MKNVDVLQYTHTAEMGVWCHYSSPVESETLASQLVSVLLNARFRYQTSLTNSPSEACRASKSLRETLIQRPLQEGRGTPAAPPPAGYD